MPQTLASLSLLSNDNDATINELHNLNMKTFQQKNYRCNVENMKGHLFQALQLLEKLNRISIYYNHSNGTTLSRSDNIPHNINFPLEKNRIVVTARPADLPFNATPPALKNINFKKRKDTEGSIKTKTKTDKKIETNADNRDRISRLKKLGFSL